jgi:hypothetical protein
MQSSEKRNKKIVKNKKLKGKSKNKNKKTISLKKLGFD